jgi:hypothetical protein
MCGQEIDGAGVAPIVIDHPRPQKACREADCKRTPLPGWIICNDHLMALMDRAYHAR